MTIVPSGSPAWSRTASHTQYGGDTNKRNYMSEAAVNPETDVDAADFCRMVEDLAAIVRTAPFCVILFDTDTGSNDPTVKECRMMTGIQDVDYAGASPPVGFPTVTRSADGVYFVDFEASYSDAYGTALECDLRSGVATICSNDYGFTATVTLSDENADGFNDRATVRVYRSSGAAYAGSYVTLQVWT